MIVVKGAHLWILLPAEKNPNSGGSGDPNSGDHQELEKG